MKRIDKVCITITVLFIPTNTAKSEVTKNRSEE